MLVEPSKLTGKEGKIRISPYDSGKVKKCEDCGKFVRKNLQSCPHCDGKKLTTRHTFYGR